MRRYLSIRLNLAKRKTNSPWGSAYKEGLPSTVVNDRIEVDEILYPSVNTGAIDVATGQWKGITLSDQQFSMQSTDLNVINGGEILVPPINDDGTWPLDMVGYTDLLMAFKPTNGGNYAITAVVAPGTIPCFNLEPTNAGQAWRGVKASESGAGTVNNILYDGTEPFNADVWNILIIQSHLRQLPNVQIKLVNNTGGTSTIESAFMRMV